MTEFELVSLLREFGGSISEQFNFWMATTFAIVIASYTAGHRLNHTFRVLLVVLYLLACWVFYLRYMGALRSVGIIAQQLHAIGSDFGPRLVPWASFGRRAVMFGGTLMAVAIVLWPSLTSKEKDVRGNESDDSR